MTKVCIKMKKGSPMVQSSGQSYLETIMLFTSVSQVIKTYNGKGEINKTCNNFHLQKYFA